MSGLKRTRSGVDAIEHAFQGVHTSENHEQIVSFETNPRLIGNRSRIQIDVVDDTPTEREVIVHLRAARTPRRRRR